MATAHTAPTVLSAVAFGGMLMSAQLLTAPLAHACTEGQLQDTVTGMCWSQSGQGQSYGGPGEGPCLPGRLGVCVGTLQKGSAGFVYTENQAQGTDPVYGDPRFTTWP
ncbi:MAG: hypothetical protein KDB50_08390 [Mycobacterium sp.]|nr:hypothetical protein [Mycobacterium sp.]